MTKKEYHAAYYKRNRDHYRKWHIKKLYGLTWDAYESMRMGQGNACAICRRVFDKTPNVDHCHKTGKVRGLLCCTCNLALGKFEAFGDEMIRYLKGSA